jgi:hypothetical protein
MVFLWKLIIHKSLPLDPFLSRLNPVLTYTPYETRISDHHWNIRLYHPEKSAMAWYYINIGHCIKFHNTSILAKISRCMEVVR